MGQEIEHRTEQLRPAVPGAVAGRVGRRLRVVASAVAAAALTVGIAACGGDETGSSSVSAADIESASGSIDVLGWQFYQVDDVQNAGPVAAKWAYISTTPEIVTKTKSGSFDVISNAAGTAPQLDALGLTASIDTDLLSNYNVIDPELRDDPTLKNEDGQVTQVPYVISPSLTAYDSSKVPEPKSLDDLLKPVYADQIALFDSPIETIGGIAAAQGVEDTREMTQDELDTAMSYLEELRPNVKTFYGFGEDVQLFNRGDVSVTMQSFGSVLAAAVELNPAIKFNFVGELTFADAWSVIADGNQAAALRWINDTLSTKGQDAIVSASGSYPVNPDALSALRDLGDPVSREIAGLTIPEILEQAPLSQGFAVESDDEDVVTVDEVTRAWNEYKAGF